MVGLFGRRGAGFVGAGIGRFNTIARNRANGKFWIGLDDRLVSPLINLCSHIANHFGCCFMGVAIGHADVFCLGWIDHQPSRITVNKMVDLQGREFADSLLIYCGVDH